MKPRALVTGGTGFIGRRVVTRLLAAGWDVVSFALPGEAAPADWAEHIQQIEGDITRPCDVASAAKDISTAIHLAALVGQAGDYDRQWAVIADGTRLLCEAVAAQGGRCVVASSIAVYGDLIQSQLCREDDGFGAWQGAYGRAKQGQEAAALDVTARTGMPLTLVRPANVYGFGGGGAWGDKLLDLMRATGGAVFGDGARNNAGLTHVDNLADALVLAATSDAAIGRTYNVCDGEPVTWRRFFDDLAALAGLPPPPEVPIEPVMAAARANEDPARLIGPADPAVPSLEGLNLIGFDNRIDATRIRRELGWQPRRIYAGVMAEARDHFARKEPA